MKSSTISTATELVEGRATGYWLLAIPHPKTSCMDSCNGDVDSM